MLRAGAAEVCITPPIGVELAGYGPRLERYSTDIHDHLYGQALVLDDGQTRLALVMADVIAIAPAFAALVRDLTHRRTSIPPENIMVACIHSHTAPTTQPFHDWGMPDRSYVRMAARHLAGAVAAADRKRQPALLSAGRGTHGALAWNRTGPDDVDPTVEVIRVDALEGGALAVLVHYACHPVILGPKSILSADYPGALRAHLKPRYPGAVILFANGACGDIDPVTNREVWGQGTFEDVDAVGAALAEDARAAAEGAVPVDPAPLAARQGLMTLPYDVPGATYVREQIAHYEAQARALGRVEEHFKEVTADVPMPRFWLRYYSLLEQRLAAGDLPEQDHAPLQVFTIGDAVALLGIPAEVYTAQGRALRQGSAFPHTLPVCYANGDIGYIAPPSEFAAGSYATSLAAAVYGGPPFKPTVGAEFLKAALPLLRR
jgi:neutral ceramidase